MFNLSRRKEENFEGKSDEEIPPKNKIERKNNGNKHKVTFSQFIVKNQSVILWIVFLSFVLLLISHIFLPLKDTSYTNIMENIADRYLSIITTWIGAIIGFYFGKQASDYLFEKLEEHRRETPILEKEYKILEKEYKTLSKNYEKMLKDYEKMLKDYEKMLKDVGKELDDLEDKFK